MRQRKWMKMKKKSLGRVGIDADTCQLRNIRVRHQVHVFESFADNTISCPILNGGYTREGQKCVPIKYSMPSLPTSLSSKIQIPVGEFDSDASEESDEEENNDVDDVESDIDICITFSMPNHVNTLHLKL